MLGLAEIISFLIDTGMIFNSIPSPIFERNFIYLNTIMRSIKGTRSKTRPGRKNYTTKKGNKVYNPKGHYLKKTHRPYSFFKGSKSKTHKGSRNFMGTRKHRVKSRR